MERVTFRVKVNDRDANMCFEMYIIKFFTTIKFLYNVLNRTVRINCSKEGKRGYDEYENVCIFRAKYCWKGVSLVE